MGNKNPYIGKIKNDGAQKVEVVKTSAKKNAVVVKNKTGK